MTPQVQNQQLTIGLRVTPIWWLQTKVFASTLGKNFISEFKQGGCFRQFFDEVSGNGSDATPAGAGPDDLVRQAGAAAATSYATTRGIVAGYETSSSIYRGIVGLTDTAAGAAAIAPLDFEEGKAFINEMKSLAKGTCQ